MSQPTYEAVFQFIAHKYQAKLLESGVTPQALNDSFDLFSEGIVDSLGMLDLISSIENEFGIELDMNAIDPEQMTVIGHLCRFVAKQRSHPSSQPTAVSQFNDE